MRPRLCLSENARELIHYFLRSERKIAGTGLWAGSHLMSQATIATIPKWMRELGGFDQTAAIDKAILPLARAGVIAAQQPLVVRPVLKALAPSALPVMEQVMSGVQPLNDELLTPTEAKKRYGSNTAKQAA